MRTTLKAASTCLPILVALGWSLQASAQTPAPAPTYYQPPPPTAGAPSTPGATTPTQPGATAPNNGQGQQGQGQQQGQPGAYPGYPQGQGYPPQGQPGAYPGYPPQGQQPGAYPGYQGQPGAYPGYPPQGQQPGAQQPQGQPGAGASGNLQLSLGTQGAQASGEANVAAGGFAAMDDEAKYKWRLRSLQWQNNLYGSTGLLRLSDPSSGAPGTFRVNVLTEWFSTSEFLCNADRPCGKDNTAGETSHFGTSASLSVTLFPFLEAFASFRSYANSNNYGRPQLLQVLGDSILGVKGFTPDEPGKLLRFGGELQLLLVNGTGGVGIDSSATGARFRGMAALDFTTQQNPLPLRVLTNIGYRLDNTSKVVEDTEASRGDMPITRIERFGLGINRTDFVEAGIGVEGVFSHVNPFLSYNIDLPINRQDYVCYESKATTKAFHDDCLGNHQDFSHMPSRLTIGARGHDIFHGLAPFAAFDIGLSGTSDFLTEVAPEAPWMLYIGVGYTVDTETAKPIIKTKEVEKIVEKAPPPQYFVRGKVVDKETGKPVSGAVVMVTGDTKGGYATASDGTFLTRNVEPGSYTFHVTADGFKPGECKVEVKAVSAANQATDANNPNANQPGQQPSWAASGSGIVTTDPYGATANPQQPGAAQTNPEKAEQSEKATGPQYTEVTCSLQALPKKGNIVGSVHDAKKGKPVSGAQIIVVDAQGKKHEVSADSNGRFSLKDLPPGGVDIKVQADKYLMHVEKGTVKPNEDAKLDIALNPRPRHSKVMVTKRQLILRRQIHFETDSAVIKGDSTALLEEIADALNRHPEILKVEVQGHTDNTGTREHNQVLSENRARAVVKWLVDHGIDASRLVAKGYGQTRPIAPNVTARNRARNRRVQFMILERRK